MDADLKDDNAVSLRQRNAEVPLYLKRIKVYPRAISGQWRRIKWAISHFLGNVMDYTVTRRLNFRADR